MTAPPPCWGSSPPPRLIPAGKASKAAKLPAPAMPSRELSLLPWVKGVGAVSAQRAGGQGGLCQAVQALPAAGHCPSPKPPG